ncbi:MAG: PVC-type heme-binding CxxCH protein [Opitutaceae bacterium]
MRFFPFVCLLVLVTGVSRLIGASPRTLEVKEGDHIVLLGNTLAERMQHHNHWETLLHQRFPRHQLTVRNLAWPADEVDLRPRAEGFGEPEQHLAAAKADVILAFFGFNESFAGPEGLAAFRARLDAWVERTLKENFSGKGAPRLALVSPLAHENLRNPDLPTGETTNRNLEAYTAVIREVAAQRNVVFADLFHPTLTLFAAGKGPYTLNGVHLTEVGDAAVAPLLDRALFGEAGAPRTVDPTLRAAVADKNFHWYHHYRIVDSFYVYGGRSGLKFADGPQTNRDVMAREREVLEIMSRNRDQRIWTLARDGNVSKPVDDSNVPPFLPVVTSFGINQSKDAGANTGQTSKTAEGSSATIQSSEATLKQFTLAPGYAINLFASEEQFPELGNAVAMAFDARGRLWVSTMPSYPQWRPGDPMNDKLLIFTDTDRDGRADRMTVFADDLHLPIGFEFALGGVIVSGQRELLLLKDTNGDDRADTREILLSGFDSADSHHVINQFTFDPGGALYFQEGTFHHSQIETAYGPVRAKNAATYRFEPFSQKLDVFVSYSYANPHGITFDRWGQAFISDSSGGANYFATAFSGYLPYPEKHSTMKQWFPKRVRPTSGCEFVTSRHFPDEAQGRFLLNNTIGVQGVLQHTRRAVGSGYEGVEIEPLVLSDDRNFRPVDMEFGPDGALYIADWQEALVGHMQYSLRDPLRDRSHARIWRVTYPSRPLVPIAAIAGEPIERLLDLLKLPEDRTRIRAKQELAQRPRAEVVAALARWMAPLNPASVADAHLLTEALWVHQWINQVNPQLLTQQLRSPEPLARAAATRVLCYWRDRLPQAIDLLAVQARDEHPLVRLEAVRAASFFTGLKAVNVALEVLNHEMDYYLTYTLEETMRALQPSPAEVKDPRALSFVLGRMTNAELTAAPASAPVFMAQIERAGLDAVTRENALVGLAKLRGTTREAELAAALNRMDERFQDPGTAAELGRLLAASPRPDLQKIAPAIQRMASKDHALPAVRRAGLAARVAMDGGPATAWANTEASTDSRTLLLEAVSLLSDPTLRTPFHPLVLALFEAGAPAANVRAAALRALPLLGDDHAAASASLLAGQLQLGNDRAIVTRSLLQLPRAAWSGLNAAALSEAILTHARTVPADQRSTQDFVEFTQLGTELASRLPTSDAQRLRKAFRELGVRVFVIKTVREQMRYDTPHLVVEAGKPFEIIFENIDIMPHNLVVVTPGSRPAIGTAATTMPAVPDRAGRLYVPVDKAVLAATKMLEPGQQERLLLTAPQQPGAYEYVCTFPGHWPIMWGTLYVTENPDTFQLPAAGAATASPPAAHAHAHAP